MMTTAMIKLIGKRCFSRALAVSSTIMVMHSFTFGPDGKLYFNFGNAGEQLKDKNGKPVLDQDGDVIGPKNINRAWYFVAILMVHMLNVLARTFVIL
jgi:hypothetical protein